MEDPNKKSVSTGQQVGKVEKRVSKEEERRLLFAATEQKITEPFKDENLDKALEKFSLTEYKVHNPKFSLVIGELKSYKKKFPLEYYRQVYRLNSWPITDTSLFERPGIVGKWTNDLIYLRFPAGTLKILQQVNPVIAKGVRLHKHFQRLTDEAEELLDKFIQDAITLMAQCSTWADFMARFAKELGHPYQLNFFETPK
jgi:hypothetical protein